MRRLEDLFKKQTKETNKKKKTIEFHYGALAAPLEEQANQQGCTLGKYSETATKLKMGLNINYVHGILTESAYDTALKSYTNKLWKIVNHWNESRCKK